MPKKHTLTTPEVESKTTDTIKLDNVLLQYLTDPSGPEARVIVHEGETDGETFTLNRATAHRIDTTKLNTELDKTVVATDTAREALERAIFAALVEDGKINAGTLS